MPQRAQRGFAHLNSSLRGARGDGPAGRLLDIVAKCWTFAFENHALYELMVSAGVLEFGTTATTEEARQSFAFVRDAIGEVVCGHRDDLDDLADILWAAMNGLIGLATPGRIAGGPSRARRLFDRLIFDLVASRQ